MRNAASWMRMSSQTRRRNFIGRVAEPATEPQPRDRIPTEGEALGEGAGSQIGTRLRSTSNQLEPIVTFMKEEVETER